MLMAVHGITCGEAFDRLRTGSRHTNVPLGALATTFIEKRGAVAAHRINSN